MTEAQATLCSCCRKEELVSISYTTPTGEQAQLELCPTCDSPASMPSQMKGKG